MNNRPASTLRGHLKRYRWRLQRADPNAPLPVFHRRWTTLRRSCAPKVRCPASEPARAKRRLRVGANKVGRDDHTGWATVGQRWASVLVMHHGRRHIRRTFGQSPPLTFGWRCDPRDRFACHGIQRLLWWPLRHAICRSQVRRCSSQQCHAIL